MKLKLFLTFDHELPLGELKTSYSASLFEPTQRVLDVANERGVKVTLFTDILCATRFKEWDNENFYLPYKSQLETALKTGHDVQLHIHPHWLTSKFDNETYYPSTHFGLSDFEKDKRFGGIEGIIELGINNLNEICRVASPDYTCLAYRAGGFNLAPSTSEIINSLYKAGIKYDCSMARGYYFKSRISEIDYRKLPKMPNWKINPEDLKTHSKEDGIIEVPIATMPKTPFEIPTRCKLKKYSLRAPVSHGHVIHQENQVGKIAKIKMLFTSRMLSFDNYTLSLDYLLQIIDYNIHKYKSYDTVMLSIISHPKSMSNYSFELMGNFITEIRKKYQDVEFLIFKDLN